MCLTGRQDAEIFRYEKMEAEAGQDVTLPCPVESHNSIHIIMIEWRKHRNENKKLALYSSIYGKKHFSPNVTLTVDNKTMDSELHLHGVTKWDSGIYICSLSTFPLGSIIGKTELKVRGKRTKLLLTFRCSAVTSNYSLTVTYDPRCSWLHQGTSALPALVIIYFRGVALPLSALPLLPSLLFFIPSPQYILNFGGR